MQSLPSRAGETNPAQDLAETDPIALLADDLERLRGEIRALYKAALPPAVIHQITRGAHEQAAIARLMLDDCMVRSANGTLNETHLANTRRWLACVRRFMESRRTAHGVSARRKFYVIRSGRAAQ